jgi:hypothetical protein
VFWPSTSSHDHTAHAGHDASSSVRPMRGADPAACAV